MNEKIFSLPFHELIITLPHLPELYRTVPFAECKTEDFESLWRFMRFIEKYRSNHDESMVERIHSRLYYAEVKKEMLGVKEGCDYEFNKTIGNAIQRLLSETIDIPLELCSDDEFKCFLYRIRDYHMGSWYIQTETGFSFFHFRKNNNWSPPSAPPLKWYAKLNKLIHWERCWWVVCYVDQGSVGGIHFVTIISRMNPPLITLLPLCGSKLDQAL